MYFELNYQKIYDILLTTTVCMYVYIYVYIFIYRLYRIKNNQAFINIFKFFLSFIHIYL